MGRDPDATLLTVRSEGGLLPAPLLLTLLREPDRLAGTDPTDFGLAVSARPAEVIDAAWTSLTARWERLDIDGTSGEGEALPSDDGRELARTWTLALLSALGWTDLTEPADGVATLPTLESAGAVPVVIVPWGTPLDRRSASSPPANAPIPHAALQGFLNDSDAHLWGVLSNGTTLRILRDSHAMTRSAYLEIDLAGLFSGQVRTDFLLLWRLLHASRFAPSPAPADCWLERWQRASASHGVRALDRLRDGVRTAIEALGTGLLSHPANTALRRRLRDGELTAADFHEQVLRLIYQVVFLLVLEERGRLHVPDVDVTRRERYRDHYGVVGLVRQARRHLGGRHPDAWQRLRLVLDGLSADAGVPELGLPSLASGLFDPSVTTDLAGTELTNRALFAALRALGQTMEDGRPTPIDHRHLGAEELGSVYESLLELVPEVDVEGRTFALIDASANERRATGAFYTPPELVSEVLDHALDPVIAEVTDGLDAAEAEHALLELTVLDPACGSAHFLIGAAHRLAQHLARIRSGDQVPAPPDIQQALRDVVSRCVYGVDINPMAVELAKVSLWLEAHVPGQPLTFLDHHFAAGDSLVGAWTDELRGDLPDAAFKRVGDDEAKVVTAWKRRAGQLGGGQATIALHTGIPSLRAVTAAARELEDSGDDSAGAVRAKAAAARAALEDPELRRAVALADAWCASFTVPKRADAGADAGVVPFERFYAVRDGGLEAAGIGSGPGGDTDGVLLGERLGDRRYVHWELAFPALAERAADGMFDVVVGNPPYVRGTDHAQADPRGRAFLSARYAACTGSQWNLYVPFVLLAARLARRRSALLVQSSILGSQYAAALHQDLLARHGIAACLDLSGVPGLFASAAVQVACLVVTRQPTASTRFVRYGEGLTVAAEADVDAEGLRRLPDGYWTLPTSGLSPDLVELFLAAETRLRDVADIRDGMDQQAAYDVRPLVHEEAGATDEVRLLPTGLIDPFRSRWGEERVRYLKSEHHRPVLRVSELRAGGFAAMADQAEAEKVCIAGMGTRIEAYADAGVHLVSKSAFVIRLSDPDLCPFAVAAYLNSTLANDLYSAAFGAIGFGAGSLNYRPPTLGALPLPPRSALRRAVGPDDAGAHLSALGRRLQDCLAGGSPSALDDDEHAALDEAVHRAFGIGH